MSRANQRRISPEERRARRQKRLRFMRRLALAVLVAGGISGGALWIDRALAVQSWSIHGPSELRQAIERQLSSMPDRGFLSTLPSSLRQQWLARIPGLADVHITRILPDRLEIQIMPRQPVGLWQDPLGHVMLVDEAGHAYRALRRNESPDLPMLRMPASDLAHAANVLAQLRRMHRAIELSELHARHDAWLMYFSRGERWSIPKHDANTALARLNALLSQPRWHAGRWRIDARNTSRWFIRPAKHEGVI